MALPPEALTFSLCWTQENPYNYDKGVLAEILEPIMGKGLIPADLETWKPRRRAIVPAFHRAYLEAMVMSVQLNPTEPRPQLTVFMSDPGSPQTWPRC